MELQNSQPEETVVVTPEPSKLRIQTDKAGYNFNEITREEAIANLKAAREKRLRWAKITLRVIGVYVAIVAVFLLIYIYRSITTGHWGRFDSPWINLISFISVIAGVTGVRSIEQKETAKALAELGDIESVGVIIEAWKLNAGNNEDQAFNKLLAASLTNLLPQLNSNNRDLVEPHQFEILYQILQKRLYKMPKPIILCLNEIGGEDAIKPLEKFIATKEDSPVANGNRELAREALASVKARVEKQREANTLLRPSSANDVAADRYLRPADFTESDSATLLRPTNHE
ncbi:MAG: hypothetical protein ABJA67_04095 [Chthonomonadales bacterium]